MSVDEKLDQQLDEILNALSYAQWELGNKGLIPLSKNINKAKQAILDLIEQEVVEARFEELRSLALEYSQCSIPERAVLDRLKVLKPQLKDKS